MLPRGSPDYLRLLFPAARVDLPTFFEPPPTVAGSVIGIAGFGDVPEAAHLQQPSAVPLGRPRIEVNTCESPEEAASYSSTV